MKKLLIGYNTFNREFFSSSPRFDLLLREGKGADFLWCHFDPDGGTIDDECARAEQLAAAVKELGVDFIANFEFQNFTFRNVSADGFDWSEHPDGTHRLELPEKYIRALASAGSLRAIGYDEFEHVICNRNLSLLLISRGKVDKATFKPLGTCYAVPQGEHLSRQIRDYAADLKKKGAPALVGEHVFPVLFHVFARNGIIPNFKSQKESISNVQFAVAAGAALEYGTELWNCVDMWFKETHPGHSPSEMYHNLVFAYLCGVDRVYVESVSAMFVKNAEGKDELNEIGKTYRRFADEYRGKDREYNVLDYKPEIGIIRYDDTFWGQGPTNFIWRYRLLGSLTVKPDKRCKEWLGVFNLITHGESDRHTLSWNRVAPQRFKPYHCFASMNGAAVFDDRVKKDKLTSLKLAFLCGLQISEETLDAVGELVRENGLTVVTPPRFAPERIAAAHDKKITRVRDGAGEWIVCDDPGSPALKNIVAPFIGKKGEMRFRFGDETVRMKLSEDRKSFIEVK